MTCPTSHTGHFVFAVHEPLLTVVKKIIYKAFAPGSEVAALSLYFLIPTLVIIFSTLLYANMKFIAPKFLRIISGGR